MEAEGPSEASKTLSHYTVQKHKIWQCPPYEQQWQQDPEYLVRGKCVDVGWAGGFSVLDGHVAAVMLAFGFP